MAMSSAESEYVVDAGCYAQVLWIKSQLADYDILYDKVPIFCDNTSVIDISNNLVLHSRTKHIDISKSHKVLGIALVAIIDRQLPFEYTIASRSTDVMVAATPQVMAIQGGRIQKANKKSLNAKRKGKMEGKGKDKRIFERKLKQVEAIGSDDLVLPNGPVICLDNCHYAPTITRELSSSLHLQTRQFERRNRTLLNIVRSTMNLTTLSLSFWDYALESAARILNMVPTKKVDKTPYELWFGKVLNLSYLKIEQEHVVMNPTPSWNESSPYFRPSLCNPENKTVAINWWTNMALSFIRLVLEISKNLPLTGFQHESVGSSNTDVLDLPCLLVLITGTSQSRQHVDTSLIHIESRKSPTAVLFDDNTGRISIRHSCELNDVQQVFVLESVPKEIYLWTLGSRLD
ncbi:retrotransposon protein, putative, ty1-copia subclass [Tanacetum coccineum]